MNYPSISCKMITYGRVHLLEESLNSFLKQEYPGKKELVIVNDYPLQKLVYDHPEVKILNLDKTFDTIGEKENFAVEQCQFDIIVQWDDDDVAMPNHLMNIAKYFTPGTNLLHWKKGVYYNDPNITDITWIGNSGIVYTKQAWESIGRHPIENAGYDMTLVEKMHRLGNIVFAEPPHDEVSWFYMWGGRGYHMSGQGHDKEGSPNVIQRHSAYVELQRVKGNIPTGEIKLDPYWRHDYIQMLKDFNASRLHNSNI